MQLPVILAGALAATLVSGHPAGDVRAEAAKQHSMFGRMARNDLSHCADKIKVRGLETRAVARRSGLLSELLMKSGELDGIISFRSHWLNSPLNFVSLTIRQRT